MAKTETDEKVMAMVEEELKKNPDASVEELQAKATSLNKSVGSLTARQFHARYPLQVKRRKASSGRGSRSTPRAKKATRAAPKQRASRTRKTAPVAAAPAASAGGADREAIRAAFLRFASDMAAAEARKDLVKVLASVDKYVDQVARASGS